MDFVCAQVLWVSFYMLKDEESDMLLIIVGDTAVGAGTFIVKDFQSFVKIRAIGIFMLSVCSTWWFLTLNCGLTQRIGTYLVFCCMRCVNHHCAYLSPGKNVSPWFMPDDSQDWKLQKKHKTGIKSTDAVLDRITIGTSGWSIRHLVPDDTICDTQWHSKRDWSLLYG